MSTPFLQSDRPVLRLEEREFGTLLGRVLSPSQPLETAELLRGRDKQLSEIRKALYSPGRHALIHGLRGVGKTSLARTVAFELTQECEPIFVACDAKTTVDSLLKDVVSAANARRPGFTSEVRKIGGGFSRWGLNISGDRTVSEGPIGSPETLNEGVRLVDFISQHYGRLPIVVIDEFDLIEDPKEQESLANLVKQVSDQKIDLKFIVCGIGSSPDRLMSSHMSIDRFFHTVSLERLSFQARLEIFAEASDVLGVEPEIGTLSKTAMISDGFPHYVHVIAEKVFWEVYEARNGGKITPELFEIALVNAAGAMDIRMRQPYETATRKYTNDYEPILWALADSHQLQRRSTDIFSSYQRIMQGLKREALERDRFNNRLNTLKRSTHASIVLGTRQGWYEFAEPMTRGYVRLRAEQNGVSLEPEHAALPPRHRTRITPP